MAQVIPNLEPLGRPNAGMYRELAVLERLRDSLPSGYDIYHSVQLHSVIGKVDRYGEIDLLVACPRGNILLIEVKAGAIILRQGEIFKMYGGAEHNIGRQCRFQYGAVVNGLKEARLHTSVSSCLVVPDYTIGLEHVVSIPNERIIDASKYDQLGTHVRALLDIGKGCDDPEALRRFLSNEFSVAPDLAVLRDQLQGAVRALSDGLATWVPRIKSESRIVRVQATAGSGKTQLALRLIEDAVGQSRSVAYLCYNRALADHIRTIAPPQAEISNFHDLAVESFRRNVGEPDFTDPTVFDIVTMAFLERCDKSPARWDVLVVDEGQDFQPQWVEAVVGLLRDGGDLYLMDDNDQRLYERPDFDCIDAVTVTCRDNYRSPRSVCNVINALGLASSSVRSMNSYKGEVPGFHVYGGAGGTVHDQTRTAIDSLLKRGFALSDIVLLTYKGRARSEILPLAHIGSWRIRAFTGTYCKQGEPIWTDGELLADSIYRYKGQSAPAVVLTEVDFDELRDIDRKRLFVGMTRAQMALEIVLTTAAERCLADALAA